MKIDERYGRKYVAVDGVGFVNEKDGMDYESSDEGKIAAKFMQFSRLFEGKAYNNIDCMLDDGCGNQRYYLVEPKTAEDVEIICAYMDTYSDDWRIYHNMCDGFYVVKVEDIKAGGKYIIMATYDGVAYIYSEESLKEGYTRDIERAFAFKGSVVPEEEIKGEDFEAV